MRYLRRIGRFLRNLFRSREAIAREEIEMQKEVLSILLSAHGEMLTDEERARAERLLGSDGNRAESDSRDEERGKP